MNGEINFTNKKYLEILKDNDNNSINGDKCEFSPSEAFFHLIKGVGKDDLENLCVQIRSKLKAVYGDDELSLDEAYSVLQGNNIRDLELTDAQKQNVQNIALEEAYEIIESNNNSETKFLGNKTIMEGKINTSGWISHSLHMGRFVETITSEINDKQNLNIDTQGVKALAILHDYGRKFDHTMGHVIKGAERLIDEGNINVAKAAVIHSFFAGKRCANNEPAVEGFYMDEKGRECFKELAPKDDIREYLDNYKLTIGDLMLNLGDLVATDKGIVPLTDRLKDIASRRPALDEEPNREFFLLQVINGMSLTLEKMNVEVPEEILVNIPKVGSGVEKANESLSALSTILYNKYKEIEEKNILLSKENKKVSLDEDEHCI